MQKRGQLLGLPLILIFGLIVGTLILFFGIRWIQNLVLEAEYINTLDTIGEIENTIKTFRNYDAGSSKIYSLQIPTRIEKICFYDFSADVRCKSNGEPCSAEDEDLLHLVLDDKYNVYILPQGLYDTNRYSIEQFQLEGGNPLCVSPGGEILFTADEDAVTIAYHG